MTYTILVNPDKTIEKTVFRPVYEKESRADDIQFLIDPDLLGTEDMTNYKVLLQVLLPHFNEDTHEEETIGKMRYMEIEEDLYLDMFKTTLPITSALTETPGRVQFWFSFYDMTDEDKPKLTKTDVGSFDVFPSGNASGAWDDEETFDVLVELQEKVDELNKSKLDKDFVYDEETGMLQFYVKGEPVGQPIPIGGGIEWTAWS